MKLKRCKQCKQLFKPQRQLQGVCSIPCSWLYSKALEAKKQKARSKEIVKIMKEKIKTHKDFLKELEFYFNKFIRLRDKDLPCISCGTIKDVKYDAGHLFAAGNYSALRFNEDNVHKQCSKNCNVSLSGNFVEYRLNLIKKIGAERVQWMEGHRHDNNKMSIDEIKEKIKYYKLKIKEYEK